MTEIQKTSASFRPVLFIGMAFSLLAAILLVRFGQTPFISPKIAVHAAPKDTAHSLFEMEQAGDATTIRFLLDKVKRDPGDMIAENMLASRMLQRVRETGSAKIIGMRLQLIPLTSRRWPRSAVFSRRAVRGPELSINTNRLRDASRTQLSWLPWATSIL